MADVTKEILLKINTDTKSVEAGLKDLEGKLSNLGNNIKTDSFKSFKQQIREATNEAQNLGAQFGLNSQQFQIAAQKVAKLKDEFADANKVIQGFNPDNKLQGLVGIASGAASAIQGVAGAFTLIGVNADTAQVAIAKLQGLMAFTDAIGQIDNIKNSFTALSGVAKNFLGSLSKGELAGIAIAGITAVGVAIYALITSTKKETEAQIAYNDSFKDFTKATADAVKKVDEVKRAFDDFRAGTISKKEALEKYNETLGDALGRTNDLGIAEKNLADKADAYIRITGLKAQANALYTVSAQKMAEGIAKATVLRADPRASKFGSEGTDILQQAQDAEEKARDIADSIKAKGDEINKQLAEEVKKYNINGGGGKGGSGGGGGTTTTKEEKKLTSNIDFGNDPLKTSYQIADDEEANQKKIQDDAAKRAASHLDDLTNLYKGFSDNQASLDIKAKQEQLDRDNQLAQDQIALEKAKHDGKIRLAEEAANTLSTLSDLAGKDTVAGKALAISAATINTWLAASQALKDNYSAFGPLAPAVRVATVASTIALGLKQVKEIVKVPVPSKGGGNGGASTTIPSGAAATVAPTLNTSIFNGSQTIQDVRVTNQPNQVVRAYITNDDLRSNQEKQQFLNKLSSF